MALIHSIPSICCTPVFLPGIGATFLSCVSSPPEHAQYIVGVVGGSSHSSQEGRRQRCGRLTDRRLLVTQLSALHRQVISQDAETEAWKTHLKNSLRPCDCQAIEPFPSPSSCVASEMLASFTTPPGPPEPLPAVSRGRVCSPPQPVSVHVRCPVVLLICSTAAFAEVVLFVICV